MIVGGYDKHIPFDTLGEELCKRAKTVVLMGVTAPKIKKAIEKAASLSGQCPRLVERPSLLEAVAAAKDAAGPGDIVILSPACASFDMFKNFEDRVTSLRGWFGT